MPTHPLETTLASVMSSRTNTHAPSARRLCQRPADKLSDDDRATSEQIDNVHVRLPPPFCHADLRRPWWAHPIVQSTVTAFLVLGVLLALRLLLSWLTGRRNYYGEFQHLHQRLNDIDSKLGSV